MVRLGNALGLEQQAASRVAALQTRIDRAISIVRTAPPRPPPRVAFLEWTDPFFCGGHWTPEIIALAGGSHPLNEAMYATLQPPMFDVPGPPFFKSTTLIKRPSSHVLLHSQHWQGRRCIEASRRR